MKSKRIMASVLIALISAIGAMAEGVRIKPFTLAANEEKDIEILFDNSTDYGGLQFDMYLPDGVSIVEDEEGLYYTNTERLQYKSGRKTVDFTIQVALMDGGFYRFLIYNTEMQNIAGESGDPILVVRLKANDRVHTSTQQIRVQGQVLATVDAEETQVRATAFPFSLVVQASIGELGYATFSWPVDLDFTGLGVQAFVATEQNSGSIHLEPIEKVPAGTGLLLKGKQGTYTLQTSYEPYEGVETNLFLGTANESATVTSDDVFVLANKSDGLGFYRAANGLVINQYKAYLKNVSGARVLFFDDDTPTQADVPRRPAEMTDEQLYTLEGLRVNAPSRAGLYIREGKKIVVRRAANRSMNRTANSK